MAENKTKGSQLTGPNHAGDPGEPNPEGRRPTVKGKRVGDPSGRSQNTTGDLTRDFTKSQPINPPSNQKEGRGILLDQGIFTIGMSALEGAISVNTPQGGKRNSKRDLSSNSETEDMPNKFSCLLDKGDDSLDISPIPSLDLNPESPREIPHEGSYLDPTHRSMPDQTVEDFIDQMYTEVNKTNQKSHKTGSNVAAFEEPINTPTPPTSPSSPAWKAEPLQYVYIMFTFVKGSLGEGKLQEFAKGFAKYIGGFASAHPPTSTHGPFFKIEASKAHKASNYNHNGIEIRYVETFINVPDFNKEKTANENTERSYAILKISPGKSIDSLKKMFNFNQYSILGASRITDKKGKPTEMIKLTSGTATPHISIVEQTGIFTHFLEPSLKGIIRCNKCQVFGHPTKKCRAKSPKCPHCAGPHTHNMCKNRKNRKCANCGLNTHGADYAGCSAYKQHKMKIDMENLRIQDEWERHVEKVKSTQLPKPKTVKTTLPPTPPRPTTAEPTITIADAEKLCVSVVKQVLTKLAEDKILNINPEEINKYLPNGMQNINSTPPPPNIPHSPQTESMVTAETEPQQQPEPQAVPDQPVGKYLPKGDTETPTPTPHPTQTEIMETAEPTQGEPASNAVPEAKTNETRTLQIAAKQNEPRPDAIQSAAETDPSNVTKMAPTATPRPNNKVVMTQITRRNRASQGKHQKKLNKLTNKSFEGYGTDISPKMIMKTSTPRPTGSYSPYN